MSEKLQQITTSLTILLMVTYLLMLLLSAIIYGVDDQSAAIEQLKDLRFKTMSFMIFVVSVSIAIQFFCQKYKYNYQTINTLGVAKHPKKIPINIQSRVAIHEVGHLITWSIVEEQPIEYYVCVREREQSDGVRGYVVPNYSSEPESKQYHYARMCVNLGGSIAEKLIYGEICAGSSQDNVSWEQRATAYFNSFGSKYGPWFTNPISEHCSKVNASTLNNLRDEQEKIVQEHLAKNIDKIQQAAKELMAQKSLSKSYINELFERIV